MVSRRALVINITIIKITTRATPDMENHLTQPRKRIPYLMQQPETLRKEYIINKLGHFIIINAGC